MQVGYYWPPDCYFCSVITKEKDFFFFLAEKFKEGKKEKDVNAYVQL